MTGPRRHALVGVGSRAAMYVEALTNGYADAGPIVAWCDGNTTRMAFYDEAVGDPPPARYAPEEFGRLLEEQRPDVVVVTSPDHTHAAYAVRALEAGRDVIVEKPLTTTAENARAIAAAEAGSPARSR